MCERDQRLIAELIVLSRQLPPLIDRALVGQVSRNQWGELADALACVVWLCRDQGVDRVLDAGDAGGR